jgi:hypothetical protein
VVFVIFFLLPGLAIHFSSDRQIASLSGAGDDPRYFQISVPVQPGNSGRGAGGCPNGHGCGLTPG